MGSRRVGHTGRKLARRWVREIQNAAVATTVSLAEQLAGLIRVIVRQELDAAAGCA